MDDLALSFSSLFPPVWQKLEEENPEFFKAYYVRLMLKNQINVFNKLLAHQCRLMNKDPSGALSITPTAPNGSDLSTCKFFSRVAFIQLS